MADLNTLSLPASARVLFASDMHLGEHDPATAHWFLECLAARRAQCSHLVLLGDLFEAWVGDDQVDPVALQVQRTLRSLAPAVTVHVMRGNRDFLLDVAPQPVAGAGSTDTHPQAFSTVTGAIMLADPCVLRVGDEAWLLSHGDALCTDDLAYQAFRRESRESGWQQAFLARPLAERERIAAQMRTQSEREKRRKPDNLTDVNERAAHALLRQAGLSRLIHGHTHRPDHHRYRSDQGDWERWVLPDWDAAPRRGGFLKLTGNRVTPVAP